MSDYSKLSNTYLKEDFVKNQELRSYLDPGYCLTVKDSNYIPDMRLCDNTLSQKFTYDPTTKQIKSSASDRCLDVEANKLANGVPIKQLNCNTGVNQKFEYDPSTKKIKANVGSTDTNRYMDIKLSGTGINSSTIQTNETSPSTSQNWVPILPNNIDRVNGFNDKTGATWDDISGTVISPEECRLKALEGNGKYVAWGYRGKGNGDYSNTCFLYKSFPSGFTGKDPGVDKIMESGCLNPGHLVYYGCNVLNSYPFSGENAYLEIPGRNSIRGTGLSDGRMYLLTIDESGLYIVNSTNNSDKTMIWTNPNPKAYSSYGLILQSNGNLTLIGNPVKRTDGTIGGGGNSVNLWNSGKSVNDSVNRLYTLRLEGQSLVIRNSNGEVFYNHQDTNANKPAVSCVLTPSYGECIPKVCGKSGKRIVKNTVKEPSKFGGPCDDKDKKYEEECINPDCINCLFIPSPPETAWSECKNTDTTKCGLKGSKTRPKYKITSNEIDGTCPQRAQTEELGCFTKPCIDKVIDSIQSIPVGDQVAYLEYPVSTKSKNTIRGSQLNDGRVYFLVLSQYGFYIINSNNPNDIEMIWPKNINDTSYTNYSSYGLILQSNGNLTLLGNPVKNPDGTIGGGGNSVNLWNSGKSVNDGVNRLYTLRLEGQSIVIRNSKDEIFYNNQDANVNQPAINCTLAPSTIVWGTCNPSTCGTTGTRTKLKYEITSPSMYGGTCDNSTDTITESCTNPDCPINCVLSPSNSDWGECSVTECGQTGTRSRNKYTKDITEMNGGTCPSYWDDMEYTPCSTDACAKISTPSNEPVDNSEPLPSNEPVDNSEPLPSNEPVDNSEPSPSNEPVDNSKPSPTIIFAPSIVDKDFISKYKWWVVGGITFLFFMIIIVIVLKKKKTE